MSEPVLLTEDRGAVRILTMNRPKKLNALSTELARALYDALLAGDADESVRAFVLAGGGRAFSAGADLSEFKEMPATQLALRKRGRLATRLLSLLRQLDKPIISVAQGLALGAGASMALGCDMFVAASDLKIGFPEVGSGMVPGIALPPLQRQLGQKLAFEMISLGRSLTAAELMDNGLANRVVEPQDALAAGIDIASQWAAKDPLALQSTKSVFYRMADLSFEEGIRMGGDISALARGIRTAHAAKAAD
jgi:enoyl-CoA hydratase/carnithine racemase